MKRLRVALCGNPNVGKSTVFNAMTGLKQHTGNWTGKTVETARGSARFGDETWELTDLPGAYSLLSGSPEEEVACDFLCFTPLDAAIVVCDATCLERNLNLALQVIEAAGRAVVCVNLMDEARRRGVTIDLRALEKGLGVPVVGVTARDGKGLDQLRAAVARAEASAPPTRYPEEVEAALEELLPALAPCLAPGVRARFAALRLLSAGEPFLRRIEQDAPEDRRVALREAYQRARDRLCPGEPIGFTIVTAGYATAQRLCAACVRQRSGPDARQLRLDRALTSKVTGGPIMLCLLGVVFYLTLAGANAPGAWLSALFDRLSPVLNGALTGVGAPEWLRSVLMDGAYRVSTWVVAVMLPPMAIFFPLFTLLEDWGFLPRVAFNLDRCFQKCKACGKQAICMMQGLGCNAVGVMGCRIIRSPRERLIAILTNSMTPCNGRFPTLIAMAAMFFGGGGAWGALFLVGALALSTGMTLACSRLLSKTVLKGLPSAFSLELPPFRRPKLGQVLTRSVLDRTLYVLGRAVTVAAPAGVVLWIMANVGVGGSTLLMTVAGALEPMGRLMGMDGAILLGFVLGFPANEIVLPIVMMVYLAQGVPGELGSLTVVREILVGQGWTVWTAACVTIFSLFHWPCSTTLWTVAKETKSVKWTLLAAAVPTAFGVGLCIAVEMVRRLIG